MTAIQPINQAPGSYRPGFDAGARAVAGPLMILLMVRLGYVVLMRLMGLVGLSPYRFLPHQLLDWLPRLVGLAAVIFYFIWGARVINTLRARGEQTDHSPAFSVWAWFIPLANFVLPGLILADLWRRATRSPAGIVALWWVGYMLFTLLDTALDLMANNFGFFGGSMALFTALSWLIFFAELAAFGAWYLIVRRITDALDNPAPATPQPVMGSNIQRS